MKRVLLCFLLFFAGCSSPTSRSGSYSIGRDPSWYPLNLGQMTVNLNGFINAFVQQLAQIENVPFQLVDAGWNQLFEGLEKNDFASVFTSLDPTDITTTSYDFSLPLLLLGPVLVVPSTSEARSLSDLKETAVGAYKYDDSVLIAQRYPSILIDTYENAVTALEAVATGQLAGALVPSLEARALITSLFSDRLKIVTAPLSDKGIRLITLRQKNPRLLQHFNEGLHTLIENGTYQALLNTYNVK